MSPHRKVTIADVARRAGVSTATVSRVINDSPNVKEYNKKRVQQVIRDLGFRPDISAQKLAGKAFKTVGLIIPSYQGIFHSFYANELLRHVGDGCQKRGFDLLLHIASGREPIRTQLLEAAIFADVISNEAQLRTLLKEGVFCVVINKELDRQDVTNICIDNAKGAYDMTEYLLSLGHRHIVHISGDMRSQAAMQRAEGFKAALTKYGIPFKGANLERGDYSRSSARQIMERMLKKPKNLPTAIFAASDDMAEEVINCLTEKGIKVPDDISIAGFDDNPRCRQSTIALTSVRQPLDEMSFMALDVIERHMAGKKVEPKKEVLPPELVIRDSASQLK